MFGMQHRSRRVNVPVQENEYGRRRRHLEYVISRHLYRMGVEECWAAPCAMESPGAGTDGPCRTRVWGRAEDPHTAELSALPRVRTSAPSKAVTLSDSCFPRVCSCRPLVTFSLLTLTLPSAPSGHAPD